MPKILDCIISAGTYDGNCVAWNYPLNTSSSDNGAQKKKLEPKFSLKHKGSVNKMSSAGKYLAAGGYEEKVVMYDIAANQEILNRPILKGSITELKFFKNSHLFVGTSLGVIQVLLQNKRWDICWEIEAHRGGVECLAVHPTGKLLLSVGSDRKFKMWDLISGKSVFATRLTTVCENISWSPSGESFCVVYGTNVTFYNAQDMSIIYKLNHSGKKINVIAYLSDSLVITGGANKALCVWDIETGEFLHNLEGVHENRVKDFKFFKIEEESYFVVSVCSGGVVACWKISKNHAELTDYKETQGRFNCVSLNCIGLGQHLKDKKKQKKFVSEESGDEENEEMSQEEK